MNAYKQFWLLTALLLSAVLYALHAGLFAWVMEKFPDTTTQSVFVIVAVLFVWTFAWRGHGTARKIRRNDLALIALSNGQLPAESATFAYLTQAQKLRNEGVRANQTHFSHLHSRQVSYFEDELTSGVGSIDAIKLFLFLLAVVVVAWGIVKGVGMSDATATITIEKLPLFLYSLISAMGLTYVPFFACLGSFMILHVLSSMLQHHIRIVTEEFDTAAYRVCVNAVPIQKCMSPFEGEEDAVSQ